jgi:phthalate 4,5-dioxygenase reductase component
MHADAVVGSKITVSAPRNHFPLKPARRYLFIAGGIGITPIRSMVRRLITEGHQEVSLVYLTRSAVETPFRDEIAMAGYTLHHTDGQGRLDLWPYLQVPNDDLEIYCCGPQSLILAVQAQTMHWRPSRLHFEEFTAPRTGYSLPFTAVWAPTGQRMPVPADRTLLATLRQHGIEVDSSCEAGVCGTCRLRLVAGDVDHRDNFLSQDERRASVISCVSRALSPEITVCPE